MKAAHLSRRAAVALLLSLAAAAPAAAHHGWAWTEDEPFELTGTIEEIYIGHPHATLKVRSDGTLWHVDLAPLGPTTRAGFDENAAAVGDEVTCVGYRSSNEGDAAMKAARVIVRGKTYDVYPNRLPES